MKNLIQLAGLLLFFFTSAFAASSASAQTTDQNELAKKDPVLFLTLQNYRVLSGRIHKMLEFRLSNLTACPTSVQSDLQTKLKGLPEYSDKREVVLATLGLYLESHLQDARCKASLDQNEKSFQDFERQKFSKVHEILKSTCQDKQQSSLAPDRTCQIKMAQVLSDLDPHCVSRQVPNFTNEYDSFPCMMADYMIGQSMVRKENWQNYLPDTNSFLNNLRKSFSNPEQRRQGIDLWQVYSTGKADTPELREEFLAQINFFFTSSQSGSSYIRGFHDHIWHLVLMTTLSPEEALDYFVATRIKVNEFRTINDWANANHFAMNIRGIQMEGKNRHNYMAAYLACHYRKESRIFHESLPVILGYAYETYDFKSHMVDEKLSYKDSRENFATDTDRYRTGVYWGYRFCQKNF